MDPKSITLKKGLNLKSLKMKIFLAIVILSFTGSLLASNCLDCEFSPTTPFTGQNFGESISKSGNTMIVGSSYYNSSKGAVYVFQKNGINWSQVATLRPSTPQENARFGRSVSIKDDLIVVGSFLEDTTNGSNAGAAYVYEKPLTGWADMSESYKITPNTAREGDFFGISVAIKNDEQIIVGSCQYGAVLSQLPDSFGQFFVFKKINGTWEQSQGPVRAGGHLGPVYGARFGNSLSVQDDRMVVGSEDFNFGGLIPTAGAAYYFEYDETSGEWGQVGDYLNASDATSGAQFGVTVSIDQDFIVVGAFKANGNTTVQSGSAYVFQKQGTTWGQVGQPLTAPVQQDSALFGSSVSVKNGAVAVGARFSDQSDFGRAYIFENIGGNFVVTEEFFANDLTVAGNFGQSVFLEDDGVYIGAPTAQVSSGEFSGKVYKYKSVKNQTQAYNGQSLNPNDSLVLMNGKTIIGEQVQFGIDNPLGTQVSGAATILALSLLPDGNFPNGVMAPGLGMNGSSGQWLINQFQILQTLFGPSWQGPGIYSPITVNIPNDCNAVGAKIYAQGLIFDPIGLNPKFGLTSGLIMTLGTR